MKYYGEILMCSPLPMRKNYETVFEILILKCLANFLNFIFGLRLCSSSSGAI